MHYHNAIGEPPYISMFHHSSAISSCSKSLPSFKEFTPKAVRLDAICPKAAVCNLSDHSIAPRKTKEIDCQPTGGSVSSWTAVVYVVRAIAASIYAKRELNTTISTNQHLKRTHLFHVIPCLMSYDVLWRPKAKSCPALKRPHRINVREWLLTGPGQVIRVANAMNIYEFHTMLYLIHLKSS